MFEINATKAARAVANYDLVKCAIHGADPNWGRIVASAGASGIDFNPIDPPLIETMRRCFHGDMFCASRLYFR